MMEVEVEDARVEFLEVEGFKWKRSKWWCNDSIWV